MKNNARVAILGTVLLVGALSLVGGAREQGDMLIAVGTGTYRLG